MISQIDKLSKKLSDLMDGDEVQHGIGDLHFAINNILDAFKYSGITEVIRFIFEKSYPEAKTEWDDEDYAEAIKGSELGFIGVFFVRAMTEFYAELTPDQAYTTLPIDLSKAMLDVMSTMFEGSECDQPLIDQLTINVNALVAVHNAR